MAEGNYTIKPVASAVLWEGDTDDNTYVDGYVMVTPPEQTFPYMQILVVSFIIIIGVAVTGVMLLRKRR